MRKMHHHQHSQQPQLQFVSLATSGGALQPAMGDVNCCLVCGQYHPAGDVHLYNYVREVDEDLMCHICLQPLVRPLDTHCGHTFCQPCLQSHLRLQTFCPIDRGTLTTNDCRPASLMVQRLLDKLVVECPNQNMCNLRMPRSDLESHLSSRCPGSVSQCPLSAYGCSFRAHWSQMPAHNELCLYRKQTPTFSAARVDLMEFIDSIPPPLPPANNSTCNVRDGNISRMEIQPSVGSGALGMSLVGGCDSPLKCIIIQSIYPGGSVAVDGRLQPGDQLVEVNGMDVTHCSHHQVVSALKSGGSVVRLAIYREQLENASLPFSGAVDHSPPPAQQALSPSSGEVSFHVGLERSPGRPLGIRVVEKRNQPGVFISDVISGSTAFRDGRIKPDDRILEINGRDVRKAKIEKASQLIQLSTKRIEFLVSRANPPSSPSSMFGDRMEQNSSPVAASLLCSPLPPPPLPPKVPCDATNKLSTTPVNCRINPDTRYLVLPKGSHESLGIRVAGGLESHQGNTPVYVQNIAPQGCLGKVKGLKKGDVLLSVNSISLLGISHAEAVAALKEATGTTVLTLGIVDGPETCTGPELFEPTWMYWHKLPRSLHLTRTVTLHRPSGTESLGFSLVGGKDLSSTNNSFHVLLVVPDSIASKEGRLRCGDRIVSVNGHRLDGLRHSDAVHLLKQSRTKVLLEILSWPGTSV